MEAGWGTNRGGMGCQQRRDGAPAGTGEKSTFLPRVNLEELHLKAYNLISILPPKKWHHHMVHERKANQREITVWKG